MERRIECIFARTQADLMLYTEFEIYLRNLPNRDKANVIVSKFNEMAGYFEEHGAQPTFDLRVEYTDGETEVKERYSVEIDLVVEYNLEDFFITEMHLTQEHPVLWTFDDLRGDLYFSGKIEEPEKAWADLQEAHEQLFKGLKPLWDYVNRGKAGLEILRSHSGKVADGPIGLLNTYAEVLQRHGAVPSIMGGYVRTYWNGDTDVPYEDLKILILNRTYVVGKGFKFKKVEY